VYARAEHRKWDAVTRLRAKRKTHHIDAGYTYSHTLYFGFRSPLLTCAD
jgi:hypothetical protein